MWRDSDEFVFQRVVSICWTKCNDFLEVFPFSFWVFQFCSDFDYFRNIWHRFTSNPMDFFPYKVQRNVSKLLLQLFSSSMIFVLKKMRRIHSSQQMFNVPLSHNPNISMRCLSKETQLASIRWFYAVSLWMFSEWLFFFLHRRRQSSGVDQLSCDYK